MTPEGKVKLAVKKLLASHGAYWYMPVPNGFGAATVDFLGCHRGRFFAIETKKPGGKLTPRQALVMEEYREHGGAAFMIDGDLTELGLWLTKGEPHGT